MALTKRLYQFSGGLAAIFLAGIGLLIIAQIVARLVGTQIPSADDFAAWSMAAAVFLALPSTFLNGGHIRVTLIFSAVSDPVRHVLDILSTLFTLGLMVWATWFVAEHVYESYKYHEVSQGIIAVPLWIPQLSMLFGMALMLLAMFERFIALLRGTDIIEPLTHSEAEGG